MTAEAYLDNLRAEMSETREQEMRRILAELDQARREVAQQRSEATRWRQEAERMLRPERQEVTT